MRNLESSRDCVALFCSSRLAFFSSSKSSGPSELSDARKLCGQYFDEYQSLLQDD